MPDNIVALRLLYPCIIITCGSIWVCLSVVSLRKLPLYVQCPFYRAIEHDCLGIPRLI